MKEIPLTQGQVALVDDADYDWLSKYNWHLKRDKSHTCYAERCINTPQGWRKMRMHREIMNAPKGMEIDHKDHNGLNNQRENLRICTRSQNSFNQRSITSPSKRSKYRGVTLNNTLHNKWTAYIRNNGTYLSLGTFASEIEAALAFDAMAIQTRGEFAATNFPRQDTLSYLRLSPQISRSRAPRYVSKFQGVSWRKDAKLWHSQIIVNRKNIHLGYFKSKMILDSPIPYDAGERLAAMAYDEAAIKYHGQGAKLNFPNPCV